MRAAKTFYDVVKTAPKGRFDGLKRNYKPEDVEKLRGSVHIEHTLATVGANKLWQSLHAEPYVNALGALTGNQAMQMVRAGLRAIYLSGWQVAADNNTAGTMYPDQSLYPCNSGPKLCMQINKTFQRADQIEHAEGRVQRDWYAPIVADAEAGFGGPLNCYEMMKAYIEAGASGVHYEDQLASEKKCGHLGGKVLISTGAHVRNLSAARLAADVCGVPTIIVARTDAESAKLLTSDIDDRDKPFIDSQAGRTSEGFFRLKAKSGLAHCIQRGLAYAEHADMLWFETSTPDVKVATEFANAIHRAFPNKLLAYNCSPSFNWEKHLSKPQIANFQKDLGALGYKFQFVTLAGFHQLNYGMYDLALGYKQHGMAAYSALQQAEIQAEQRGYTAVQHQREVGTTYFDQVALIAGGGKSSTTAWEGSTEKSHFNEGVDATYQKKQAAHYHTSSISRGPNVEQRAPTAEASDDEILTPEAVKFLTGLERQFRSKRKQLLDARQERQARNDAGELPKFLDETREIRKSKWTIAGVPADLQDRRVEITGPVDRKMVVNALNSGAKTYMADFEDSCTPTWRNLIDGQRNLMNANKNSIDFADPQSGKQYALHKNPAVLLVRPRGWHLDEKHLFVDDQPMSGSLFDFGLYFFHNARTLLNKGSGPYFYLPKMESYREAQLWDEVFRYAQTQLNIPHGSIKVTCLVEHILGTFQCDEILYALKDHIVGLNCGRWDYIFSYIKVFRNHADRVLPDRVQVTMTVPFMRAYTQYVIKTCHRRGAHAMGGMSAYIPIKHNEKENDAAMSAVLTDKEREVKDGHDGTWVAHPGLVPLAMETFDKFMRTPNQVSKQITSADPTAEQLLAVPDGTKTEEGLRRNISVSLGYLEAWLRGAGCVPLYNLMEDAATAEISRSIIWHWTRHNVKLSDGRLVNNQLVERLLNEESLKLAEQLQNSPTLKEASDMFLDLVQQGRLADFLTLQAYDKILAKGQ